MNLSQTQLNALETWIRTNNQSRFDESSVALLNAPAAPPFTVWRTNVAMIEIMQDVGFDWARVDNLSVGKARVWDWMKELGVLDPSKVNIRSGIEAAWTGTAPDLAVKAVIYTHCKRLATLAEKMFAAGTGSDAVPATMGPEGLITLQNVTDSDSS